MIHKVSVIMELTFDDDNGEYAIPSTREVENKIEHSLYRVVQEMGFDKQIDIEAAHGDLEETFGIDSFDEEAIDGFAEKIRNITPKKKRSN